jgi:predicted hydrocarbon binding protein
VTEPAGLYYPNRIARAYFSAMDDVMGQHGLSTLLGLANLTQYVQTLPPDNLKREFDFASLSAMNQALEQMYGPRGGRGMSLRIGRAAFARGLKNFGVMRGLGDAAFRALPLEQRLDLGLQALASLFSHFTDQASSVAGENNSFLFRVEVSPFAWGRTSDKPVCHALIGVIQECLSWASNGYEFHVWEINCRACGSDACTFRVNKTPIGEKAG